MYHVWRVICGVCGVVCGVSKGLSICQTITASNANISRKCLTPTPFAITPFPQIDRHYPIYPTHIPSTRSPLSRFPNPFTINAIAKSIYHQRDRPNHLPKPFIINAIADSIYHQLDRPTHLPSTRSPTQSACHYSACSLDLEYIESKHYKTLNTEVQKNKRILAAFIQKLTADKIN